LSLLLTTISIQRKAGGNLAAALSVVSTAITGRHRVRNEIATLTAEARYTSLIILALPVVMLALLNQVLPGSVTALLGNPLGWFLIAFFIAVQMVAFIAISRIARVRV
jgi:tight adherence protein B